MPVTERLMASGQWTLTLRDDTPQEILDSVTGHDCIVITPTHLTPIGEIVDATILDAALYTGVVLELEANRRVWRGQSPLIWLGNADGVGKNVGQTPASFFATDLSDVLADLFTVIAEAGLEVGSTDDTGLDQIDKRVFPAWLTVREWIDAACLAAGAEFRLNPDFLIDFASPTVLFPTATTPTVYITRHSAGEEGALRGVQSGNISGGESWLNVLTAVIAVDESGIGNSAASLFPATEVGLSGSALVLQKTIDAKTEEITNAITVAQRMAANASQHERRIVLDSALYGISGFVEPGDTVGVYDLDAGIVDTDNQIQWRGELIAPLHLRVHGVTWPIEYGMGVYLRRWRSAALTYVDLTDYVIFEGQDGDITQGTAAAGLRPPPKPRGMPSQGEPGIYGPAVGGAPAVRDGGEPGYKPAVRGGGGGYTPARRVSTLEVGSPNSAVNQFNQRPATIGATAYLGAGPSIVDRPALVTTFDPTIDQGASANIAHTLTLSEWHYDGIMVEWWFVLTLTAGGSAGSAVLVDLPVATVDTTTRDIGGGLIFDSSASTQYSCRCLSTTSGTQIAFNGDVAGSGSWGATPSIALASGDVIRGTVRYRYA